MTVSPRRGPPVRPAVRLVTHALSSRSTTLRQSGSVSPIAESRSIVSACSAAGSAAKTAAARCGAQIRQHDGDCLHVLADEKLCQRFDRGLFQKIEALRARLQAAEWCVGLDRRRLNLVAVRRPATPAREPAARTGEIRPPRRPALRDPFA